MIGDFKNRVPGIQIPIIAIPHSIIYLIFISMFPRFGRYWGGLQKYQRSTATPAAKPSFQGRKKPRRVGTRISIGGIVARSEATRWGHHSGGASWGRSGRGRLRSASGGQLGPPHLGIAQWGHQLGPLYGGGCKLGSPHLGAPQRRCHLGGPEGPKGNLGGSRLGHHCGNAS